MCPLTSFLRTFELQMYVCLYVYLLIDVFIYLVFNVVLKNILLI